MKKIMNIVLVALLVAGTYTKSYSQDNISFAASTGPINDPLKVLTELRGKNLAVETTKKAVSVKTKTADKKVVSNTIKVNNPFLKGSITSTDQIKQLADGSFLLNVKQSTSLVGDVAIKDANIVYNNQGIVSVHLNLEKSKAALFVAAHVAKYGKPNNEKVLDNFSWILGDYVLEILEGDNGYVATYVKATPGEQYINEGLQSTLF